MGDTAAALTDFGDLPKVVVLVDKNGNAISSTTPLSGNIQTIGGSPLVTPADGASTPTNAIPTQTFPMAWNGSNWDKLRDNEDGFTAIASASYTTTQTIADQLNINARGVIVVVNMTVVGTGSITPEIDGKDPATGQYYSTLTASAAITGNGVFVYQVYPGTSTTVTNTGITQSSGMVLPRTWRIKVTANNANAATYAVGFMLII